MGGLNVTPQPPPGIPSDSPLFGGVSHPNPVLAEIHSHVASMSPGAQAAIHSVLPSGGAPPSVMGANPPNKIPPMPVPGNSQHAAPIGGGPTTNPDPQGSLRPGGTTPPAPILPPGSPQHAGAPPMRGTTQGDQNHLNDLLSQGSGISQIHSKIEGALPNHPLLGKILGWGAQIPAMLGDAAVSAVAPELTANLPGTQYHHNQLVRQDQRQIGQDTENSLKGAQTGEQQALTGKTQEETAEMPGKTASEEALQGAQTQKDLTPPEAGIDKQTYDFLTKQLKMTPQQAYQEMQQEKGEPGREQSAELRHESLAQQDELRHDAMNQAALFHSDSEKDRALTRAQIAANAEEKKNKPTGDEQKKADLVDNLNENLDTVEEIARRRPDLFGPFAGRLTELKNTVGTKDPDIGALETAQHNLGMVQQGVHGLRSAQGIQGAVDALMNGFHNSPEVILKSIETARKSGKTFTNAVGEKGQPGIGGVPGAAGGNISVQAPNGKSYNFPDQASADAFKQKAGIK